MQRRLLISVIVATTVLAACGGGGKTIPPANPTPAPVQTQKLYVAEGGLNQIAVLDPATGAQLGAIPVGKTPVKLAYNFYSHSLWVANAGDNTVVKIDTESDKVVGKVSVGSDPEWIDTSSEGDYVDVANRGSKTVTQIKAADLTVQDSFTTSGGPLTVDAYDAMVTEDNGKVEFFEGKPSTPSASFTVTNGLQGGAQTDVDTAGGFFILYYTAYDGKVSEYTPGYSGDHISSLASVGTYTLPVGAGQIYHGYGGPIVVNAVTNQVSQVDVGDRKVAFTTKVGNGPRGACNNGDGTVYVANSADDTVSVIDPSGKTTNTFKLSAGAHPEDVAYTIQYLPPSPTPAPTATPSVAPTSTPTTSPTATPAAIQHLYVANGSGGNVLEYTSPFSASSAPSVNVRIGGNVWGVASDSNYVAVEDSTGFIYIFAQPLSASASPIAQFQAGAQGAQLLFDSSGNLFTGTQSTEVLEYSPPFSSSSTPAKVINGTAASFSLAMDYNSNLYAGDLGMNRIDIFASPYTGTPTTVAQPGTYGLASYATYLYGADASGGAIDVYTLPMSGSSTPSFTIANADPHALAADIASGTLYVGDQHGGSGSGSVDVYTQPLNGTSAPAYSVTSGVTEPVQVWIGP